MSERDVKSLILDTFTDYISNFMFYDRHEDEELPYGAIENAISDGKITIDDLCDKLREQLTTSVCDEEGEQ